MYNLLFVFVGVVLCSAIERVSGCSSTLLIGLVWLMWLTGTVYGVVLLDRRNK